MIGVIIEPLVQVPWIYILSVLLLSSVFIVMHSKMSGLDSRREMLVFFKGAAFVVMFAFISLSTALVLKYASYLKIDIIQLSYFEFFFLTALLCIFVAEISFVPEGRRGADKGGIVFGYMRKVPYLLKQAGLYVFMVIVAYYFNPDASVLYTLAAVVPVNAVYHLFYLGFGGRSLQYLLKIFDMLDSFFDRAFGSSGRIGDRTLGHKARKGAGK
ncbi:MAG: hypothetical protein U9O53_01240 [archaeon]|nr:hypothetical protein [archaeon]